MFCTGSVGYGTATERGLSCAAGGAGEGDERKQRNACSFRADGGCGPKQSLLPDGMERAWRGDRNQLESVQRGPIPSAAQCDAGKMDWSKAGAGKSRRCKGNGIRSGREPGHNARRVAKDFAAGASPYLFRPGQRWTDSSVHWADGLATQGKFLSELRFVSRCAAIACASEDD